MHGKSSRQSGGPENRERWEPGPSAGGEWTWKMQGRTAGQVAPDG